MKAHYRTRDGRITFEVQGETPKNLFADIASIQEVFEAESCCGICKGTDIRFQHRMVDDYQFYELACMTAGCRARFQFGQAKKGGALFPKRKDEDGGWLPNNGWAKFQKPGTTNGESEIPRYTRESLPDAGSMREGQECMYWDGKIERRLRVEDTPEGAKWSNVRTM